VSQYYLDSSALVKRYMRETGTQWVRTLVQPSSANVIVTAKITHVEIMSAVTRHMRTGIISLRTTQVIQQMLARHMKQDYMQLELTDAVVQRAITLMYVHPLRGYDAVQLASALESHARLLNTGGLGLTFVTADQRLLQAAGAEGLPTDDPNNHP
jgi:hypothetical protein